MAKKTAREEDSRKSEAGQGQRQALKPSYSRERKLDGPSGPFRFAKTPQER